MVKKGTKCHDNRDNNHFCTRVKFKPSNNADGIIWIKITIGMKNQGH